MARLSQIVRNKADVVVTIPGTDDAGAPVEVPVTVTYKPRLMTLAWKDRFREHMRVVVKAEAASAAAAERGQDPDAAIDAAAVEEAVNAMSDMTLGLLDGWDLEDEAEDGTVVPVPLPRTVEDIKTFPSPELLEAVLQGVMAALNPNRGAGEAGKTSPAPSPAT